MTIEITLFDIENGLKNVRDAQYNELIQDEIYTGCPIALAVKRAGYGTPRVGMNSLRFGNKYIPLPSQAERFNRNLMFGGELKPFSFDLDIKQSW